jgi:transcriptional regulator with XRE-family HTH domain
LSAFPVSGGIITEPAFELGQALHLHRLACGLSLRRLAAQLGLSSHSGLVDYERGVRIPPEDLLPAYCRALKVPSDYLGELRQRALLEVAVGKVAGSPAAAHGGSSEVLSVTLMSLRTPMARVEGLTAIIGRFREIVAIGLILGAEELVIAARRVNPDAPDGRC